MHVSTKKHFLMKTLLQARKLKTILSLGNMISLTRNIAQPFKQKWAQNRSSHQGCSVRKGVLRNFAKFTGKHLCQSLFFNKVTGLRPATLLKKKLWHRCFLVNFVKFLRALFLQNTSGRLLLLKLSFSLGSNGCS